MQQQYKSAAYHPAAHSALVPHLASCGPPGAASTALRPARHASALASSWETRFIRCASASPDLHFGGRCVAASERQGIDRWIVGLIALPFTLPCPTHPPAQLQQRSKREEAVGVVVCRWALSHLLQRLRTSG